MRVQSSRVLLRPIWVAAFALGVLLPLLGLTARAQAAAPTAAVQQQTAAPADHGGGNKRADFRGKIEQLPATNDLVGDWVVAGKTYAVTSDTEIKQRYARAAVGVCVAGELADDNTTVREVMTLPAWACTKPGNGGGDDNGGNNAVGGGELYARISSMPTPSGQLTGTWVIGTLTFSATETTKFNQENGKFAEGTYVRVKFYILPDGTFVATDIRTAIKPDTGDDDDHHGGHGGHGHHEGEEGKAFGVVEVTPTDSITGIWQISGITYSVSYSTELRGSIGISTPVKVEYYLDANSNRVATEIKALPGTSRPDGAFRLVGTVDVTPTEGFIGNWVIDGVPFVADSTSIFSETHGILAVDAFVRVNYVITNNERLIKTIETVRMPGSGEHDHWGRVERTDDGSVDSAAGEAAATWQVGGQTFVVNDATQIDSKLTVNSLATVNSYTAADGTQVATRISAANATNSLFLPTLSK